MSIGCISIHVGKCWVAKKSSSWGDASPRLPHHQPLHSCAYGFLVECDDRLEDMRAELKAAGLLRPMADLPTHKDVLLGRFNVANTTDVVVNTAEAKPKRGGCAVM